MTTKLDMTFFRVSLVIGDLVHVMACRLLDFNLSTETELTNCQLEPQEQTSVKSSSTIQNIILRKCF